MTERIRVEELRELEMREAGRPGQAVTRRPANRRFSTPVRLAGTRRPPRVSVISSHRYHMLRSFPERGSTVADGLEHAAQDLQSPS